MLLLLLLLTAALEVVWWVLKAGRVTRTPAAIVKAEDSLYKAGTGALGGQGVAWTAPRAASPESLVLVVPRTAIRVLVLLLEVGNMSRAPIPIPVVLDVRVVSWAALIPV